MVYTSSNTFAYVTVLFANAFTIVSAGLDTQLKALKATTTPCCVDTLLPGVCKSLYNRDHERFASLCRTNPDFSFIQCCNSCHFHNDLFTGNAIRLNPVPSDLYRTDAEEMLLRPQNGNCFDRHGPLFCEAFVTRTGPWARSAMTCEHSAFAFRVCRKTCGYCTATKPATVDYDANVARNPKQCQRLF